MQPKIKIIAVAVLGLAAVLFVYVILGSLSRSGKAELTLVVAPSTASVTLDGQQVKGESIFVGTGQHTIVATLDNFEKIERQVDIQSTEPTRVSIALSPSNAAGKKYLDDNLTYQLQREGIIGEENPQRDALSQNSLVSLLPITDVSGPYSINYGSSEARKDGSVIIIGDSSPNGRVKAVKWLRDKGYKPGDIEIRYTDFVNPLAPVLDGSVE